MIVPRVNAQLRDIPLFLENLFEIPSLCTTCIYELLETELTSQVAMYIARLEAEANPKEMEAAVMREARVEYSNSPGQPLPHPGAAARPPRGLCVAHAEQALAPPQRLAAPSPAVPQPDDPHAAPSPARFLRLAPRALGPGFSAAPVLLLALSLPPAAAATTTATATTKDDSTNARTEGVAHGQYFTHAE
ncbi:hypothetical protein Pelo_16426 [Pelomyxa schiedti]|nr:hypothetical protein Pelo_16426 [Pelomyxa schiedti]